MKDIEKLKSEKKHDFDSLISVMSCLRGDGGCPWDREQTHKSVRKCLIEETYEVVEAIDTDDEKLLCEELGDLMFQVVFHAQIEAEKGSFSIEDVVDGITSKMISRHPHVFGEVSADTSDEVLKNWDTIKKEEKNIATAADALKRVPPHLPELLRSQKIQGKAQRKHGFGIKSRESALSLAKEILNKDSVSDDDIARCVFDLCAASEYSGADLEASLSAVNNGFIDDFEASENK